MNDESKLYLKRSKRGNRRRKSKRSKSSFGFRLTWLRKGSRDLFGTIVEKNIYILIDTSVSMKNHLEFVKDKLRLLIKVRFRSATSRS